MGLGVGFIGGRTAALAAGRAADLTAVATPCADGGSTLRPHQAVRPVADEILPSRLDERLADEGGVFGAIILEKCALKLLFVVVRHHVDGLAVQWVDAGVKHDCGGRAGGGVVVLHLLGRVVVALEAEGQLYGLTQGGAGMAGHKVGNQVLLLAHLAAQVKVLLAEGLVYAEIRLAHAAQDRGRAVLGGNLQLARDVILHQLAEEGIVRIRHQIVKTNARADKHLLDPRQGLDGTQKINVLSVVSDEVRTGRGGKALAVGANAVLQLFFAGRVAEIGGRAAHVVNVALEIRHFGDLFRLRNHRFNTARAHGAPLVKGQRAEIAGAEAATVVGDREAYLLDARYAAILFVDGVVGAGVGKGVYGVQLFSFKGRHGGILNQKLVVVYLTDSLAVDGVLVAVLHPEGGGVGTLVGLEDVVVKGVGHGEVNGIPLLGAAEIYRAPHVADLADGYALVEELCDAAQDVLTHAVGQKVGAAVHEDGATHLVVPVVVMREAAKGGLQATEDDGNIAIGLADAVGVDDGGAVGAQAGLAAGGVVVVGAFALGGGVVGDHGVDVARRDQKAESGAAVFLKGLGRLVVGLGEDRHAVALGLQHAGDDGYAKGGVIDVSVTRNVDKIRSVPAPRVHVGAGEGEKIG